MTEAQILTYFCAGTFWLITIIALAVLVWRIQFGSKGNRK